LVHDFKLPYGGDFVASLTMLSALSKSEFKKRLSIATGQNQEFAELARKVASRL
jgi:hypothetical protein